MKIDKRAIIRFFMIFGMLVFVGHSHVFANGKTANQDAKDKKRIHDLLQIADYIETYHRMTGAYPLVKEPQEHMATVLLTKHPPRNMPVAFPYIDLENSLRVIGEDIQLPLDPDDGEDWRFYQYATNGQHYYVSAFLYNPHPFARQQGREHHKIEITSKPCLRCVQYKIRDIRRFIGVGTDQVDTQQELWETLESRDFKTAKKLLEQGANPSPVCAFHHRCQPLATAAENGDLELIKFLLENGADIDGYNAYYDVALIYALSADQTEAAKLLIQSGANVNLPNAFGMTPFIGVCMTGDIALAKLMIDNGAEVNRRFLVQNSSAKPGQKNVYPLEAAIKSGSAAMVSLLLEAGASTSAKTEDGQMIGEIGKKSENPDVKSLFQKSHSSK